MSSALSWRNSRVERDAGSLMTQSSYPSLSLTNAHTLGNSCCYYTVDERCALYVDSYAMQKFEQERKNSLCKWSIAAVDYCTVLSDRYVVGASLLYNSSVHHQTYFYNIKKWIFYNFIENVLLEPFCAQNTRPEQLSVRVLISNFYILWENVYLLFKGFHLNNCEIE